MIDEEIGDKGVSTHAFGVNNKISDFFPIHLLFFSSNTNSK
jgi:hypothetical protein